MWQLTLLNSYLNDQLIVSIKPTRIRSQSQWIVLQCGRGARHGHEYYVDEGNKVKDLFEQSQLIKLEQQLKASTGVAYKASAVLLGNGAHYITLCLQPNNTYAVVDDTYFVHTIEECIERKYKALFILLVRSEMCGLERPLLTVPANKSLRCLSTSCAAFWSRLPDVWWKALSANLPPDMMKHVPLLTNLMRSYFANSVNEDDTIAVQKQFLRGRAYGKTCDSHPCIQDFMREVDSITPKYIKSDDRAYEVDGNYVISATKVPALINIVPTSTTYTDRTSASA
jgi:hypothetical protein